MASAAKSDRNRAIDFYRAIAMLAVAIGHWMAMHIALDDSGELVAGNALEAAPGMAVMTWLFQVMPLFFVVGGFSSAMSLDSFFRSPSFRSPSAAPGIRQIPKNDTPRRSSLAAAITRLRSPSAAPGIRQVPKNDRPRRSSLAAAITRLRSPSAAPGRDTLRPRNQDWVVARLRRMLPPAVALAATWAIAIVLGYAFGQGELVAVAATAAAIPLWFLANYTIDTAIAPYVLPRFRKHPVALPALGVLLFIALEAARFAGIPFLPHLNWVLGWLLFQIAGFAWRDGLLPTGKAMGATATGFWIAAITAVTVGPWPVSMVHFPGLENSPTHPPSLALMLFGAAYSCTAIAAAPAVSRWLAARPKAWAGVVAANAVAMSVYLWHFTAAIVAGAIFYIAGWLPTAAVGTAAWWLQKLPLMAVSAIVLAAIVAKVMPIERRALLAPRTAWVGGQRSLLVVAGVLSTALKQWAHGEFTIAALCIAVVITLWHGVIKSEAFITRLARS